MSNIPSGNGRCSFLASTVSPSNQRSNSSVAVRITGMALEWMGATMELASLVKNPNSSSLPLAGELSVFAAIQARGRAGRQAGGGGQLPAHGLLPWFAYLCVNLSKKCGAQARGAEARGQVAGIARSMSCSIALKAFAAGDKVCPFYLRTLASNVHKSGGISTVERRSQARSPPQSRAGSSARTKQTEKPAGFVPAGSDCSALSAGPKRQDNRIRKLQTYARTSCTR
jgi:hypothetical protein